MVIYFSGVGVTFSFDCDGVAFTCSISSSFLDLICKRRFFDVFCAGLAGNDGVPAFDCSDGDESLAIVDRVAVDPIGEFPSESLPKPELPLLDSSELEVASSINTIGLIGWMYLRGIGYITA